MYFDGLMTQPEKIQLLVITTHELAHTWFGNLVTYRWFNQAYLNEGFASYYQFILTDYVEGNNMNVTEYSLLLRYAELDAFSLVSDPRADVLSLELNETRLFSEIRNANDNYRAYIKGAWIVSMMVNIMSESLFLTAIRTYLKKFQYGHVQQNHLFEVLNMYADSEGVELPEGGMQAVMDTWTKNPGFPLIKIDVNSGQYTLQQSPYELGGDENDYVWWIPVHYIEIPLKMGESSRKLYGEPVFKQTWLGEDKKTIEVEDDNIIIVNWKQVGYYLVDYDENGWEKIAELLLVDHNKVDPQTRAQILYNFDKLLDLKESTDGDKLGQLYLRLHDYLRYETEFVPWAIGLNNLNKSIVYAAEVSNEEQVNKTKEFAFSLIEPYFTSHQLHDISTSHKILLKAEMMKFACEWEYFLCFKESTRLLRQWMDSPDPDNEPLLPDLLPIVIDIVPNLKSSVIAPALKIESIENSPEDFLADRYRFLDQNMTKGISRWQMEYFRDLSSFANKDSGNRMIGDDNRGMLFNKKIHHKKKLELVIKDWKKFIRHSRESVPSLISKIFGKTFTTSTIEHMEFFRSKNINLSSNELEMMSKLITKAKEVQVKRMKFHDSLGMILARKW